MSAAPIFDAVCATHGLWPVERPIGSVRTLALTHLCDECGMPYDDVCSGELHPIADLVRSAFADLCYRCTGPEAARIDPVEPDDGLCEGCRGEVRMAAENARWTWFWEGHDDEWGPL